MFWLRSDLTTAHILYQRPDHLWLLQEYVWQDYDLTPEFPKLRKFLKFWREKIDGPLWSVTVAHAALDGPLDFQFADFHGTIH